MKRNQPYSFGFADSVIAEAGRVPLDALHYDTEAICRSYDAIAPVADRLGVEAPRPRLAGFSYCHVSALGARVVFAQGSEPNVVPILREPSDIDRLSEPRDYLQAGVIPARLRAREALLADFGDTIPMVSPKLVKLGIGHTYEGPVTTAALLMGPSFFTLPYEDPKRAHRLLAFCVDSALNYSRIIGAYLGEDPRPGTVGIPDDFAGIFPPEVFAEFAAPYWDRLYDGLEATERHLHSELLRQEHLPFLTQLRIALFDPSADQYVTPELLRAHCPVPFTSRILSWHIRDNTPTALEHLYRRFAACHPHSISFYMDSLATEPKIHALLQTARQLAQQSSP